MTDLDLEARLIVEALDILLLRIERMQAHPGYTRAIVHVQKARNAVESARVDISLREAKS
jgi:hypothetical protein